MKLAFCIFKYFPFGGLQQDFKRIVEAARDRGHECTLLTMSWEGETISGTTLQIIPIRGLTNHIRAKRFSDAVTKIIKENPFDEVIGFNKIANLSFYYAGDVCFKAKALTRYGFLAYLLPRTRISMALEEAVFENPHCKIAVLSIMQAKIFQSLYSMDTSRFIFCAPMILKNTYSSAESLSLRKTWREKYHIHDDDRVLIAIGSGFKTKGLDKTLDALAQFPSALKTRTHLWVFGKGDSSSFQSMLQKNKLEKQVVFFNVVPDVYPYLFAADLLVHPARVEAGGKVILEALNAGVPVVVTENCGYATEVAAAQAGEVIATENLSKTLLKIFNIHPYAEWKQQAEKLRNRFQQSDATQVFLQAIENRGERL